MPSVVWFAVTWMLGALASVSAFGSAVYGSKPLLLLAFLFTGLTVYVEQFYRAAVLEENR